jgi:hypothetical protein
MKGKAFKEEGKEDYQEMMFNQLVFKEKGGPMKIEEARTENIYRGEVRAARKQNSTSE